MGKIKETIEEGKAKGKKKLLKAAAVVVSAGLLTAGTLALIDNIPQQGNSQNSIQGPEPIVLEIDEEDMTATSESEEEEEEEKKRGFFGYLKAALYGMAAAIGGWIATKIPWKKIFSKRTFYILLALVFLYLCIRFILPVFVDVPWGPDKA